VPDPIFADPRLAAVYDAFDGPRDDLEAYLAICDELGAHRVADVGCGTGSLAVRLVTRGLEVTGVDPAAASLDVARGKSGADAVTWILGEARDLPLGWADIAFMTGNVAQIFLTDDAWSETLSSIHDALRSGGHLVFEARRPERQVWRDWAARSTRTTRNLPGIGEVIQEFELTVVHLPLVTFRHTFRFDDGSESVSQSTLRFRSRGELADSVAASGFDLLDVRDAPDRPDCEYVVVARRTT
jgi:SAM-dependent methyltransferase